MRTLMILAIAAMPSGVTMSLKEYTSRFGNLR